MANLSKLIVALERLKGLSDFDCFKEKIGENKSLSDVIQREAQQAIEVLEEIIELIQDRVTLEFLIDGKKEE